MPHELMSIIHKHSREPVRELHYERNPLEYASKLARTNKEFNNIFRSDILDPSWDPYILHRALSYGNNYNEETTLHLIKSFPDVARTRYNIENPLHLAIKKESSMDVINALIFAYVGALEITDGEGNLPLHVAVIEIVKEYVPKIFKLLRHNTHTDTQTAWPI